MSLGVAVGAVVIYAMRVINSSVREVTTSFVLLLSFKQRTSAWNHSLIQDHFVSDTGTLRFALFHETDRQHVKEPVAVIQLAGNLLLHMRPVVLVKEPVRARKRAQQSKHPECIWHPAFFSETEVHLHFTLHVDESVKQLLFGRRHCAAFEPYSVVLGAKELALLHSNEVVHRAERRLDGRKEVLVPNHDLMQGREVKFDYIDGLRWFNWELYHGT